MLGFGQQTRGSFAHHQACLSVWAQGLDMSVNRAAPKGMPDTQASKNYRWEHEEMSVSNATSGMFKLCDKGLRVRIYVPTVFVYVIECNVLYL